jgi:hypothetical protein
MIDFFSICFPGRCVFFLLTRLAGLFTIDKSKQGQYDR